MNRSTTIGTWIPFMLFFGACSDQADQASEPIELTELPFQQIELDNLEGFEDPGPNWTIVKNVTSDFQDSTGLEVTPGTGVLVNRMINGENDLFTRFEHGDIELDIEFLIPKGSNSGIYFQSRYEIQILDSWLVENPRSYDCGAIYERWDESKPEGEKGFEGHAPRQNASLAPGLWQHFHIKFRAPRFDDSGQKIANARFEEVTLNGLTIHENVELSGPTRGASESDEVSMAPLRFQGDHGHVSFRNFRYKLYGTDTLTTSNVSYEYYEVETPITALPDFDSLEVIESGAAEVMDVNNLSRRRDGVAFRFTGDLNVIKPGGYLFHLYSDDGSRLFLDNQLVIDHDGKHDLEPKLQLSRLSEGVHSIQIDYFNNNWGKGFMLLYEGPEQELRTLQGLYPYETDSRKERLIVNPEAKPEMIRSFVYHKEDKITHGISVGNPEGIHYSYDLRNGALLKVWRGAFADVTEMWQGRGIEQVLVPPGMALTLPKNALLTHENRGQASLNSEVNYQGYELDSAGRPVFIYQYGESRILDSYTPLEIGLKRTVRIEGKYQQLDIPAGSGSYIDWVNQDLIVMAGKYYIKNLGYAAIGISGDPESSDIFFTLGPDLKMIEYVIIW